LGEFQAGGRGRDKMTSSVKNIAIRKTKSKGLGIFALRDFKKGELIFRYEPGRIISRDDLGSLTSWEADHLDELDDDKFEILSGPSAYVNHSCDPNAIKKGRSYYALKPIKKGEEICHDYRDKGIFKNKWKCSCASRNCRGYVISDFFTLPEDRQKLYLPYTLRTIREEYKRRRQGPKRPLRNPAF
jgi:hypothetical protein